MHSIATTSPFSSSNPETDFLPALRAWFVRRASPSDVEDLVQDVMLRLHARAAADPIDNLEAYLFRTAAASLADFGRRRVVRQGSAHVELLESHHPIEEVTPERVLVGREKLATLIAGIDSMGDRTRQVFMLSRFEDMTYGSIAAMLGISVSAVEKHVMKALRHLTELGLP